MTIKEYLKNNETLFVNLSKTFYLRICLVDFTNMVVELKGENMLGLDITEYSGLSLETQIDKVKDVAIERILQNYYYTYI